MHSRRHPTCFVLACAHDSPLAFRSLHARFEFILCLHAYFLRRSIFFSLSPPPVTFFSGGNVAPKGAAHHMSHNHTINRCSQRLAHMSHRLFLTLTTKRNGHIYSSVNCRGRLTSNRRPQLLTGVNNRRKSALFKHAHACAARRFCLVN